jgi:ATP-dependent Lon protease
MFECFEPDVKSKSFYQKIYGIRVVIQNEKLKKTLVVNGIIEDVPIECFTNAYIIERTSQFRKINEKYSQPESNILRRLADTITLKDILIYGNEDMSKKIIAAIREANIVKQNKLENTIQKFLDMDLYSQRNVIINLLMYDNDDDVQYACYLLYDLISANDSESSLEKRYVYDSLSWKLKSYFKDAVQKSIKRNHDLIQRYDFHKITLEQQIHMMKAGDSIKEKAIAKFKELKNKPEDAGVKTKNYLEGLVKIPFGIYREEPILKKVKETNRWFIRLLDLLFHFFPETKPMIPKKEKYTTIEIYNIIESIEKYIDHHILDYISNKCEKQPAKQIINAIKYINAQKKQEKIKITNQTKSAQIESILRFLQSNHEYRLPLYDKIDIENPISLTKTMSDIQTLKTNSMQMEETLAKIMSVLDRSIYGHEHAKNQLMKIIGQWINGEQSGYCFGFEGSPGVGKTSLAKKGLANCLVDEKDVARPFAFIAIGGSANGSLLEGHGYSYVNSTWGKIADILMEAKCLNPIIYVDELDKVSKTEHGREIISIFTHLIDPTQNDLYQDKYFSGINIDLSKALFIFSYNDPEQIDRVLLDRIHRIKFENLFLDDKLVIVKRFLLPELNEKVGFENVVEFSDEIVEYIIENYTVEPGVRKLKEILFDIYGEINLELLKCSQTVNYELPIQITKENLENKYLTKYQKINSKMIHSNPQVGIINGLWANSLGRGGIIPIQTMFYPATSFLELKLTGLQGDVMKESMNVAKSLAWKLTSSDIKKEWMEQFKETNCQGLHIHCPEGGISKDGPSAGAAITCAIYSLFNSKTIKNAIAITGEICLNGEIAAIGGLDVKIIGGVRAGVKTFFYPSANHREFVEWKKTYKNQSQLEGIQFIEISTIQDALDVVFVEP